MMETEPITTSLANILNKQSANKHTAFFGSFGRVATTPNEWHLEDQEVQKFKKTDRIWNVLTIG
jgi:hypothetical protein